MRAKQKMVVVVSQPFIGGSPIVGVFFFSRKTPTTCDLPDFFFSCPVFKKRSPEHKKKKKTSKSIFEERREVLFFFSMSMTTRAKTRTNKKTLRSGNSYPSYPNQKRARTIPAPKKDPPSNSTSKKRARTKSAQTPEERICSIEERIRSLEGELLPIRERQHQPPLLQQIKARFEQLEERIHSLEKQNNVEKELLSLQDQQHQLALLQKNQSRVFDHGLEELNARVTSSDGRFFEQKRRLNNWWKNFSRLWQKVYMPNQPDPLLAAYSNGSHRESRTTERDYNDQDPEGTETEGELTETEVELTETEGEPTGVKSNRRFQGHSSIYPRRGRPLGHSGRCSVCKKGGHNKKTCPDRTSGEKLASIMYVGVQGTS